MKIIERRQEGSQWVVRIANAEETRSMFLNFLTEPTDAEVRAAFQGLLDAERAAKDAQAAEQSDEVVKLGVIREGIIRYETGQLTNVQSRNLLEALIVRLRKHGLI